MTGKTGSQSSSSPRCILFYVSPTVNKFHQIEDLSEIQSFYKTHLVLRYNLSALWEQRLSSL